MADNSQDLPSSPTGTPANASGTHLGPKQSPISEPDTEADEEASSESSESDGEPEFVTDNIPPPPPHPVVRARPGPHIPQNLQQGPMRGGLIGARGRGRGFGVPRRLPPMPMRPRPDPTGVHLDNPATPAVAHIGRPTDKHGRVVHHNVVGELRSVQAHQEISLLHQHYGNHNDLLVAGQTDPALAPQMNEYHSFVGPDETSRKPVSAQLAFENEEDYHPSERVTKAVSDANSEAEAQIEWKHTGFLNAELVELLESQGLGRMRPIQATAVAQFDSPQFSGVPNGPRGVQGAVMLGPSAIGKTLFAELLLTKTSIGSYQAQLDKDASIRVAKGQQADPQPQRRMTEKIRISSLVVVPTRQLARQYTQNITRNNNASGQGKCHVLLVCGDMEYPEKFQGLGYIPYGTLVATLGRLADLLRKNYIDLSMLDLAVFDDVHQMLPANPNEVAANQKSQWQGLDDKPRYAEFVEVLNAIFAVQSKRIGRDPMKVLAMAPFLRTSAKLTLLGHVFNGLEIDDPIIIDASSEVDSAVKVDVVFSDVSEILQPDDQIVQFVADYFSVTQANPKFAQTTNVREAHLLREIVAEIKRCAEINSTLPEGEPIYNPTFLVICSKRETCDQLETFLAHFFRGEQLRNYVGSIHGKRTPGDRAMGDLTELQFQAKFGSVLCGVKGICLITPTIGTAGMNWLQNPIVFAYDLAFSFEANDLEHFGPLELFHGAYTRAGRMGSRGRMLNLYHPGNVKEQQYSLPICQDFDQKGRLSELPANFRKHYEDLSEEERQELDGVALKKVSNMADMDWSVQNGEWVDSQAKLDGEEVSQ